MRRHLAFVTVAVALFVSAPVAPALSGQTLDPEILKNFRWREIGPANMAGRITDVEGIPSPSKTFYVASAAGGIWKSTNNGTTFRPLFQNERVISLGDIAIAPSDTLQIWAGTGEEDSRNSISPGGGIYKSSDGGLTWELKGLEETEVIAQPVVRGIPLPARPFRKCAVWRPCRRLDPVSSGEMLSLSSALPCHRTGLRAPEPFLRTLGRCLHRSERHHS